MASLLSVNAGSSDKMQRYISNCYSMGIEVISPSINLSGIDFTVKKDQILFGLSAIKSKPAVTISMEPTRVIC